MTNEFLSSERQAVLEPGVRDREYRDSRRGSCWDPVSFPLPVLQARQRSLGKAVLQLVGAAGSRQLRGDMQGEASPGAPCTMAAASTGLALGPSRAAALECSKYSSLSQIKPEEIVQMVILTQQCYYLLAFPYHLIPPAHFPPFSSPFPQEFGD